MDDILNAAELDLFTIIARAPFKLMKYPGKLTDSNEIPKRPLVAPSPYLTLNVASFAKRSLPSDWPMNSFPFLCLINLCTVEKEKDV